MDARIAQLHESDPDDWKSAVEVLKDFTIECSMLKVYGSEGVGYVLDEALQIHGGYGFTREYPIEQPLRDVRVNRIFEGTNEINRLLVPGTLFKRVMQGNLNLMPVMMALEAEVKSGVATEVPDGAAPLALETFMNEQAKKVFTYAAGAAAQKYMADLDRQQELLLALADMLTDVWASDSTLARVHQYVADHGPEKARSRLAVARVVCTDAYRKVAGRAREIACHLANNPARMVAGIDRLAPYVPTDLIAARSEIADAVVAANRYPF
jgi:alkylation response protein AidB-like acyl-CoA dehydrogenase